MSSSSNHPNGWTFERALHATARFVLPHAIIKNITPIYYVYLDKLGPGLKKLFGGKKKTTSHVPERELEAVGG